MCTSCLVIGAIVLSIATGLYLIGRKRNWFRKEEIVLKNPSPDIDVSEEEVIEVEEKIEEQTNQVETTVLEQEKENNESEEAETVESILTGLIKDKNFTNSTDLLEKLTSTYIKDVGFSNISQLPKNIEDLLDVITKLELTKEFEEALEEKYKKS